MDIDKFLTLLDEPKVQDKIKSILSDNLSVKNNSSENQENMIKSLRNLICGKEKEISDNTSEIDQLKQQLSVLTHKNMDQENELKHLTTEGEKIQLQLNESDKKLNWYREQFSEDVKVKEIYSNLSDMTQGSLEGIFKSTTVNGLIACGIQEKNIGNLWEYVKNEVVNDQNPDIQKIIHLFDILFSRFTIAFPMYEAQKVTVGDDFDTQLCIRHNSSKNVSGTVASILLRGYINTKTSKVIKPSIVRI